MKVQAITLLLLFSSLSVYADSFDALGEVYTTLIVLIITLFHNLIYLCVAATREETHTLYSILNVIMCAIIPIRGVLRLTSHKPSISDFTPLGVITILFYLVGIGVSIRSIIRYVNNSDNTYD